MTDGPDHYTASICARLCLRRHAEAASPEAAMDAARATMTRAVRQAVDVAHGEGCEVEIDADYLVTYPSAPPDRPAPPVRDDALIVEKVIKPFLGDPA